jgi:hypothetical protein
MGVHPVLKRWCRNRQVMIDHRIFTMAAEGMRPSQMMGKSAREMIGLSTKRQGAHMIHEHTSLHVERRSTSGRRTL